MWCSGAITGFWVNRYRPQSENAGEVTQSHRSCKIILNALTLFLIATVSNVPVDSSGIEYSIISAASFHNWTRLSLVILKNGFMLKSGLPQPLPRGV